MITWDFHDTDRRRMVAASQPPTWPLGIMAGLLLAGTVLIWLGVYEFGNVVWMLSRGR